MQKLLDIMATLRRDCPWDQAQTPQSLTKYAIEEAYEVEAAVKSGNVQEVKEELGDLLLQVVFQSQMYQEQGAFDFSDVVDAICEKLIRRHPHVFQAEQFQNLSEEDVALLWQKIKATEKQGQPTSYLSKIKHGPALQQAQQLQHVAAKVGFDFETVNQAFEKVEEEIQELKEAIVNKNDKEIMAELGDCLFSLINVARKTDQQAELALLQTNHKFRARFAYIEQALAQQEKTVDDVSLEVLDQLWDQAKIHLRATHGE